MFLSMNAWVVFCLVSILLVLLPCRVTIGAEPTQNRQGQVGADRTDTRIQYSKISERLADTKLSVEKPAEEQKEDLRDVRVRPLETETAANQKKARSRQTSEQRERKTRAVVAVQQ